MGQWKQYGLYDVINSMDHAWDDSQLMFERAEYLLRWCHEHDVRVYGDPRAGMFRDSGECRYGISCYMSWTAIKELAKTLYRMSENKDQLRRDFLKKVKITDAKRRARQNRKVVEVFESGFIFNPTPEMVSMIEVEETA